VQADQLQGQERLTHPFARVRVGDQSQLTTVQWQSLSPTWEEALFFRDVCAASELVVEAWDVGGSRSSEQLQRLTVDPVKVIANSRFLGRVEVPLSETLRLRRGERFTAFLSPHDVCEPLNPSQGDHCSLQEHSLFPLLLESCKSCNHGIFVKR
jgi:hypothetical protein